MKKYLFITLIALFPQFASSNAFLLNDYNLITLGDFSSNSEVEGRTFVGGDIIGTSSHNYGIHLSAPFNGPTLQVAGSINGGGSSGPLSIVGGLVVGMGNTVKWNGQQKVNNRKVNNAVWISQTNLDTVRDDFENQLIDNSQSFRDMTSNSTVTIPSGQPSAYKFNVDQSLGVDDYAVFDISQWGLFTNTKVQQIEMLVNNINSLAGIVINVGGVNANWSNSGNKVGSVFTSLIGREKILWNFYEAQTIQLHTHSFMGSLLAPYATVTSATPIEGSLGVFSLLTTSEVHLPTSIIAAPQITSVPEPNSSTLMAGAFIVLLYSRYRLFKVANKHE
ncbi:MAG: choice-of-anchor A family protein [Alteromonadaceae bacterium]